MPTQEDYYKVLGVARGASEDEIRKAHRRLVRKYHPDVNPGDKSAEERFKKIQEAYDILSDAKKRQMFDQYGFYSDNIQPGAGGPGANGAQPGGFGFEGFDFSDIFGPGGAAAGRQQTSSGGGSFKDLFGQFFKGQRRAEEVERGGDLEYALDIDFWQSIKGTQVRLNINRQEICTECHGTGEGSGGPQTCPECHGKKQVEQMIGAMRFTITCPRCGGSGKTSNACQVCKGDGRVSKPEVVEVRIPAGTLSGSRLRVAGKGNAGTQGGPAGDLYITVRVAPHSFFRREGDNIEIRVPVTVPEAGLGAKIEVPTIDGKALLKIPQGTQNGQKLRLREKGVSNPRKSTRGDQIVEIHIEQPNVANEHTRELLRELSKLDSADPRAEMWSKV